MLSWTEFDKARFSQIKIEKREVGNPGSRRTGRKYLSAYAAFDIETTELDEYRQSVMYIWQFNINGETFYGRTWEEFQAFMDEMAALMAENVYLIVFVHNLSFEFQYLAGIYKFVPAEVFCSAPRKVLKCEMLGHFEFRCSYQLTNMSLREFLKSTGVSDQKLELDYSKRRFPWTPLTESELKYCENDVNGLVEAIWMLKNTEEDTWYSLPLTSTGYVRRDCKAAIRRGTIRSEMYAMQPDPKLFRMLRAAFRGGNTHASRFYAGYTLKNVVSYDRASSYPAEQCEKPFPMGRFVFVPGADFDDIDRWIYNRGKAVLMTIRLANLRLRDMNNGAPYISESLCVAAGAELDNGRILSAEAIEMTITDLDYKIICHDYMWDSGEVKEACFARYGMLPLAFREAVVAYYVKKTKLKGVEGEEYAYSRAKAKLNSIYGMSATNPAKADIIFDGDNFSIDETQTLDVLLKRNARKCFMPYQWGVWTTAWARWELQRGIWAAGYNFVYCDTDSVKCLGDFPADQLNKTQIQLAQQYGAFADDPKGIRHYMGVFERDATYDQFRTLGAKKYACVRDGRLRITISGVIKDIGAEELGDIDRMEEGFTFTAAGGLAAVFNDQPPLSVIAEGRVLPLIRNVYLYQDSYTIGLTDEYKKLLKSVNFLLTTNQEDGTLDTKGEESDAFLEKDPGLGQQNAADVVYSGYC